MMNQFISLLLLLLLRRRPLLLFTSVAIISCLVPGGLAVNVLVASDTVAVKARQYLNVSNVHLVLQPDCDLILYNNSNLPYLSTNTSVSGPSSARNCSLFMQIDANLVLYNFKRSNDTQLAHHNAIWDSYTPTSSSDNSTNHNFLILKSDASYTLYEYVNHLNTQVVNPVNQLQPYFAPSNQSGTLETIGYPFPPDSAWKPDSSLDNYPYMPAEYFISEGFKLQTPAGSSYGQFVLELGTDCNLQSKKLNGSVQSVLWQTGTNSSENRECQLTLQRDGRLVLRGKNSGTLYWNSTNVVGNESVNWFLTLDYENGQLRIVDILNWSNTPYWTSPIATTSQAASSKGKMNSSIIVLITVGVLGGAFVVVLTVLGLYFALEPRFLDPAEKELRRRLQTNGGQSQVFSQTKIKQATDNFRTVLGVGGFGDVFYGKLPDGQEIAAKVLSADSHQSKVEFYNEIELLSMVNHKYLVSLLGYTCTRKHQVLIYEYMGGGDLRYRLQGENVDMNPLTWRQRTTIAHQVAEGLEYLHDKCSPSIIHRDVKSTNILLTNKMVAKVADFGLSKLRSIGQEDATHITTIVKGTPGYLDPEYHETGLLMDKSDVYAFGIVLMEILTGLHPMKIANRVREAWISELLDDLVDPNLGEDYNRDEFESLVELALWCVKLKSFERPFMRQVVQRFREIGLISIEPPQPELNVSLGEEARNVEAFEIISLESDIAPLTESSSSSCMSSDAFIHSRRLRSRQSMMI